METVSRVFDIILLVIAIIAAHNVFFMVLGFIVPPKKFKKSNKQYKYAVVIAARNEGKILAQTLHCIQEQDYPQDLLTVFVVAHNCDDDTAEVARREGAIVFEYNNPKERTRGYALKHGFEMIKQKYEKGVYEFDGYMMTDADFVMEKNYITEMNNAFDNKKYDVFIGYLNSKNTDRGLIASYRSVQYYSINCTIQRPRAFVGVNTNVNCPAIFARNFLYHDGYNCTSMGDDMEFTCFYTSNGYRATYVPAAKFYT